MNVATVESDTPLTVAGAPAASPPFATLSRLSIVEPLVSFIVFDASVATPIATPSAMLGDTAVASPRSSELHRLLLTSATASSQRPSAGPDSPAAWLETVPVRTDAAGDASRAAAAAAQWESAATALLLDVPTAPADSELVTHSSEPPCSSPTSFEWRGSGGGPGGCTSDHDEGVPGAGHAAADVSPTAAEAAETGTPTAPSMEELLRAMLLQTAAPPPPATTVATARSVSEPGASASDAAATTPSPPVGAASHGSEAASSASGTSPSTPSLPVTPSGSPGAADAERPHTDAGALVAAPVVHRAPANTPSRLASWIRSRVSQNKIRFRDGDFNLDLTYITRRIIAMGYPAHGTEYYIRNPIDEVERFFDERHGGHFRIYNLCAERAYDSVQRFHGCFRRIPFEDHNAPSLPLIMRFVRDAAAFLDADAANVVGVHCKAGKGRTGIMVSCLLFYMYSARFASANAAMDYFDTQRTSDGAGLTIPSQRRYVKYFEQVLSECHGAVPFPPRRLGLREVLIRVARQSSILHTGDLYFVVSNHERVLLDSRVLFPRGPTISAAGCVFAFSSLKADVEVPTLEGDVKVAVFRRRPIVISGKESTACYLWFNTTLCPSLNMTFHREELDKVDVAAVGKSVMVSLSLARVGEVVAPEAPCSVQTALATVANSARE